MLHGNAAISNEEWSSRTPRSLGLEFDPEGTRSVVRKQR